MKSALKTVICLAIALAPTTSALAKKAELSSLELQQMQSRDVEASKPIAFSAVMTVLQDAGYRIGSADKDTGLITGTASTNSKVTWMPFVGLGRSKKTPVVSAYVEELSPNITRVRLNFVMTALMSNQYGSDVGETPIVDPFVYQTAFEKIDQAIFIRKAMTNTPSPAPAVTPVAAAIAPGPSVVAPSTAAAGMTSPPASLAATPTTASTAQ